MSSTHRLRFSAVTFALFFLGACGKKGGDLSLEDLDKKNIWGYSSQITCENASECPNEVALLSYPHPEKDSAGFCTGTMIGQTTLLTNAHCIPKKVRQDHASCDNEMWVVFPKNNTYDELVIECQEVLYVAKNVEDEGGESFDGATALPDFAMVKLKRNPNRGHLPLSREGFKEGDKVTFYKSNPSESEKRISSTLEKIDCKFSTSDQVSDGLVTNSDSKNPELVRRLRTMVFTNCGSMGGNSGTAAIVNGSIRGVLFGGSSKTVYITNFSFPELNMLEPMLSTVFTRGVK